MLNVGSNPGLNSATGSMDSGGVLDLAARRLQWLGARQQVLASNVANSDTPGYRPRDVASFTDQLSQVTMQAARTDPAHFAIDQDQGVAGVQTIAHERAPDGNAISLQQQLTEIAGNDSDQRMTTSLYSKVMQMYSTVLGR